MRIKFEKNKKLFREAQRARREWQQCLDLALEERKFTNFDMF